MKQQIGIHTLWPTPILEVSYGDRFQKEIDDIIDKVEFVRAPDGWGKTHKISKPANGFFYDDVIGVYGLKEIGKEIDTLAREYCAMFNLKYATYRRTSWFVLMEKGDFAHMHTHGAAALSGAYYYKTTGEDGNIYFHCPVGPMKSNPTFTAMGSPRHIFQAEEGKMLMFPGWADHGVMQNETGDRRISLSFNIEFDYFAGQRTERVEEAPEE